MPLLLERIPLHEPKRRRYNQYHLRAELAAIAAEIIHGYSHIATDSLTSMHQLKRQLSHPNLHRHHIQEVSSKPLPKQSTIHHRPFITTKLNPTHVLQALIMLTLLLESKPQPTLTLRIPLSKQLALKEIPSASSTGLQKNMKIFQIIQQPNAARSPIGRGSYLKALVPI